MDQRALITGGNGFIGSHLADRLSRDGWQVTIYDDRSRRGATANAAWLSSTHPRLRQVTGDVRDREPLTELVAGLRPQLVVHLAAQVAVTTSVANPRHDFEVNALGTFNVLEAVRVASPETVVVYASTNKVYGKLDGLAVVEEAQRYAFGDRPFGVDESQPLDFYSPYGCSKGAGDQYVRDYQRIYGLRTVLLRLSCIYGPRQFGVEDQGWLAWFAIAAMLGRAVTLCGDGKQVRDVLYVDDLVEAILAAYQRVDRVAGVPLNLGGGPARALAVWSEYAPLLQQLAGCLPVVTLADWRPGDQRIYVSDIRRAEQLLGWVPRIDPATGAERMIRWVKDHRQVIASVLVV